MTQRSRLRPTNSSGSKSKVDADLLPNLFYDDLEYSRNSVGLVHPFVLESLYKDRRGASKQSNRKTISTAGTSKNEERTLGIISNGTKSSKNVLTDVGEKNLPNYPLAGKKLIITSSKTCSKSIIKESEVKEGTPYKSETIKTKRQTSRNTKTDEVLPTRDLRSRSQYAESSRELRSVGDFSIENMNWYYKDENYYKKMCSAIMSDFAIPKEQRSKMNATLSYTYLLLDSRWCKNKRNISWSDFVEAIFYIGKGTGQRAFQHAKDAEKWLATTDSSKLTNGKTYKKFLKIKEIWQSGNSIKVFFVTEQILDAEALTREAAMIVAMGLNRVCNLKNGDWARAGVAATLRARERFELGATLLVEARDIFRSKKATDVYPKQKLATSSNKKRYCNNNESDEYDISYTVLSARTDARQTLSC